MDDNIIACICEGGAEHAIMDILLENNALIFEKHQLLDGKMLDTRSASKFEQQYLRKDFNKKITIYRILDSRRENFKLSELYKDKVEVINVITAPEIEMLIIHNENKHKEFLKLKSKTNPGDFCKNILGLKKVKTYKFVREYFSDINVLLAVVKEYHQKSNIQKNEIALYDLLKIKN